MKYSGYKNREEIFEYIEECFPFVGKPKDTDLMIYGDEDCISRYIREHIKIYNEPKIPNEGVCYLHDELRNLSAKGIVWLLPSLLRKAVLSDCYDPISEFLVYDLESDFCKSGGVKERYFLLSQEQNKCLVSVLEYFSEEFSCSVAQAQENIAKLNV